MEKRELICIGCPMGCPLTVQLEDGEILSITGQTCKRGEVYARNEVTNPTRIVTSTVMVEGGKGFRQDKGQYTQGKDFPVCQGLKGRDRKGTCAYWRCDCCQCG